MSDTSKFALPSTERNADGTVYAQFFGMTLREYFAAQALQGLCANSIPGGRHHPERRAAEAVECADALLVELAKERS